MSKIQFTMQEWEEFLRNIDFSDNELDIIPFMRREWYQVDIAAELEISRSTVKRRMTSIINKITLYILRTREPKFNII